MRRVTEDIVKTRPWTEAGDAEGQLGSDGDHDRIWAAVVEEATAFPDQLHRTVVRQLLGYGEG
jgi:hypothetical protein